MVYMWQQNACVWWRWCSGHVPPMHLGRGGSISRALPTPRSLPDANYSLSRNYAIPFPAQSSLSAGRSRLEKVPSANNFCASQPRNSVPRSPTLFAFCFLLFDCVLGADGRISHQATHFLYCLAQKEATMRKFWAVYLDDLWIFSFSVKRGPDADDFRFNSKHFCGRAGWYWINSTAAAKQTHCIPTENVRIVAIHKSRKEVATSGGCQKHKRLCWEKCSDLWCCLQEWKLMIKYS
jgi:hypothetical protein